MLKKIIYENTCHRPRPFCPTVHIISDDNSDDTLWAIDIGFDTEEDGWVAVRIKAQDGVAWDVSMYVQQDKGDIISYYAYTFSYKLCEKYIPKLLKAKIESLLPYEEKKKIDMKDRTWVEKVAIEFINEILATGELCRIDGCEFRENYNKSFKCAYYNGEAIWKNIRREEKKNCKNM